MKNENGFSLVELLIVVAIIAIIAAIAVPSLLTSRMAANEASAIQGLRTIGSAEIAYAATANQQFTDLSGLATGSFLDSRFMNAGDFINGFSYDETQAVATDGLTSIASFDPWSAGAPQTFAVTAIPNTGLGRFSYGIGPDQVVRWVDAVTPYTLPTGAATGGPIGKSQ
jgi:prepilin-type N-terminal cleavage/methylation domain-containing protein